MFFFGILKNNQPTSHVKWENACKYLNMEYRVIDLTQEDWYEQVTEKTINCCLLRPPGQISRFIDQYKQRIRIINEYLEIPVFPSLRQIDIYEDKRYLAYFLKANGINHPETKIFYYKTEALQYLKNARFPLVGKTSHGAAGTGVVILRTYDKAKSYVNKAFSTGIKRTVGPNRVTGSIEKWIKKAKNVHYLLRKLKEYRDIYQDPQRGFVIFQQHIPHDFEWRVVNIGGSYFAHKKIKVGDKASGSKGIDYVSPPHALLDFAKSLCEIEQFDSMAVDIFEDTEQGFLVNELQTIFGHEQDHIMEVGGKPGRYICPDGKWIFEQGDFNSNESYNLRLKHVMKLLEAAKGIS